MRPLGRSMAGRLPLPAYFYLQRLLLTPLFRVGLLTVLVLIASLACAIWISDAKNLGRARALLDQTMEFVKFSDRLGVTDLAVEIRSPILRTDLEQIVGFEANASPFELDARSLRKALEELPTVKHAQVNVVPGGSLEIAISEREPAVMLRRADSVLLLDRNGELAVEPDPELTDGTLPLIAGEGAVLQVPEALAIYAAAAPIRDAIRGLVRVGERRWNLELDGNRVIQLPAENPTAATRHLLAFDRAERLLSREFLIIDLRTVDQITVRLSPEIFSGAVNSGIEDNRSGS